MRRLLLLPVLALVALFLGAAPASAAEITSFTINNGTADITATVGEEIAWSAEVTADGDSDLAVAQTGDAATSPDVDGWGGPIQPTDEGTFSVTAKGTYTFSITATEDGESATSELITVTVDEAAGNPTVIPFPDVTFPGSCTVVLPETENVNFGVGFGNYGDGLDAGTYDLSDFYNFGYPITIGASPDTGFVFPKDTKTFFELTPSADCFPQLVTVKDVCQAIEFTNTTDDTLVVQFGDIDLESPDEEFDLAAGATRSLSTERESGFFTVTLQGDDEFTQAGSVDVEQDCTPASADEASPTANFPTVAPAAGAGTTSSAGTTSVLSLVALLGVALVGGRRLLHSA